MTAQQNLRCALRVSWEGVRSYLNNPWMDASLSGRGDNYRHRISEAILDGNLESVLDEHLWVTAILRHLAPEALIDQLRTALSLRTSDVKLYGLKGRESDFYLRSHAALAFNQEVSRYRTGMDKGKEPGVHSRGSTNRVQQPVLALCPCHDIRGPRGARFPRVVWVNRSLGLARQSRGLGAERRASQSVCWPICPTSASQDVRS